MSKYALLDIWLYDRNILNLGRIDTKSYSSMCLHELQDVILIFIRPVEVNAKQNTLYVYL